MEANICELYSSRGLPLPIFVTSDRLGELKNFPLRSDDVFIVTYPKCGTTWTQQIVKLLRNNGQQDNTNLTLSLPWLENSEISLDLESVIQPRGFKSHMPYDRFPYGNPKETPSKYIYVARNPKDVAVSFYYHTKAAFFPNMDRESFWKEFIHGELEFGDYFDHILSWWAHKEDKNMLFLRYENMQKDLVSSISQIATFIGAEVSDEVIKKVAEQTKFDNMKRNDLANCAWPEHVREKNKSKTEFMRKGIVGDWKNFLTQEQSAEIDALCATRLSPVGLCFDFES